MDVCHWRTCLANFHSIPQLTCDPSSDGEIQHAQQPLIGTWPHTDKNLQLRFGIEVQNSGTKGLWGVCINSWTKKKAERIKYYGGQCSSNNAPPNCAVTYAKQSHTPAPSSHIAGSTKCKKGPANIAGVAPLAWFRSLVGPEKLNKTRRRTLHA